MWLHSIVVLTVVHALLYFSKNTFVCILNDCHRRSLFVQRHVLVFHLDRRRRSLTRRLNINEVKWSSPPFYVRHQSMSKTLTQANTLLVDQGHVIELPEQFGPWERAKRDGLCTANTRTPRQTLAWVLTSRLHGARRHKWAKSLPCWE